VISSCFRHFFNSSFLITVFILAFVSHLKFIISYLTLCKGCIPTAIGTALSGLFVLYLTSNIFYLARIYFFIFVFLSSFIFLFYFFTSNSFSPFHKRDACGSGGFITIPYYLFRATCFLFRVHLTFNIYNLLLITVVW
jgi:hypothetical protein